jgi:L-fuculose-phosphate aldolase
MPGSETKDAMVEIGRRLWQRGLVAGTEGNLSARLEGDRLLTTPTGVSKGFMTADMLVLTDLDGRVLEGDRQPSSELKMHVEVYRNRPEINAVVHAHPPVATAFSVAGVALDRCVLPETVVTMGAIPTVPYSTPTTEEMPASLRPFIARCDAVLLSNHGAVTWAEDLEAAWFKMECLEMTATILQNALLLGGINDLSAAEVKKLSEIRTRLGLPGRVLPCEAVGGRRRLRTNQDQSKLVATVVRAVLDALKRPATK